MRTVMYCKASRAVVAVTFAICWAGGVQADINDILNALQSYYPLDNDFNDAVGTNHMTDVNAKTSIESAGSLAGSGHLRSDASIFDPSLSGASRVMGGAGDFGISSEYTITAWYKLRDGNWRNDLRGEKWPVGTMQRDFMFYNPDDGNESFALASYTDTFGIRTVGTIKSAGLGVNDIPPSLGGASCPAEECDDIASESDWHFVATRVMSDGTHQLWVGNQNDAAPTEIHNDVLAFYRDIGGAWDGNTLILGSLEQKADDNHGALVDGAGAVFADDVAIFNVALVDSDITEIFLAGQDGIGVVPPLALPGDYDRNGIVGASDYSLFRNHLGSDTALPNDDGIGTPISQSHYNLWKSNFGNTAAIGGNTVPEPASLALAMVACLALVFRRDPGGQRR